MSGGNFYPRTGTFYDNERQPKEKTINCALIQSKILQIITVN
uniref:Uncharacterized protein n=1 Tax=Anopheles dirus TaxID=7168 RepID=A0A182NY00_9DIPT